MRPAYRWTLAPLLALVMLSACGDSLVGPPPSGFGTFRGTLDGEAFNGYGWAVLIGDSVHIFGRRDINTEIGAAEEIRISALFIGQGSYQITDAIHGEVERGSAQFSARAPGQMVVTTYDGTYLVGTISLALAGSSGWRFEGGNFDLPIFHSFDDVPVLPGPALPPEPPM